MEPEAKLRMMERLRAQLVRSGGSITAELAHDMMVRLLDTHPEAAERVLKRGRTLRGAARALERAGWGLPRIEAEDNVFRYFGVLREARDQREHPRPPAAWDDPDTDLGAIMEAIRWTGAYS